MESDLTNNGWAAAPRAVSADGHTSLHSGLRLALVAPRAENDLVP